MATANVASMARTLLPLSLVAAALAADGRGARELAFYLLVTAVPAAAVSALTAFGDLLDRPDAGDALARLHVALGALGLTAVLVAAAVRGQAPEGHAPPALAAPVLSACLALFVGQALAALAAATLRHPR